MISSAKLIVAALLLSSATVYAHETTSSHLRGSSEIAWNPYKHVEKHVKKHAKKAIDGKHGRKYVEKKCDCGSTSSYTTSSSYDSEDNAEVEEDMEFEDESWNKHVIGQFNPMSLSQPFRLEQISEECGNFTVLGLTGTGRKNVRTFECSLQKLAQTFGY